MKAPIVRARVYEQTPHPMLGPAKYVVVAFDSPGWRDMDRRRIKRERNRALKQWRDKRRRRRLNGD